MLQCHNKKEHFETATHPEYENKFTVHSSTFAVT